MNQISVFLENRPGALGEMTKILADQSIDMKALSLSEAEGFGLVRFIVDDDYKTTTVLKEKGFVHKIVPVVAASIPNEPGGLLKVLNILESEEINIEYMYAFIGEDNGADMVFKVKDAPKAKSVLKSKGIEILEQ